MREVGNFSHARGHLRVSGVLLDGPRKNRDYFLNREFKAGLNLSAQLCFFTFHQLLLFPKYVKYQQVQSNNANIKTKLNAGLALRQRADLL